jgi:hypothetical protein
LSDLAAVGAGLRLAQLDTTATGYGLARTRQMTRAKSSSHGCEFTGAGKYGGGRFVASFSNPAKLQQKNSSQTPAFLVSPTAQRRPAGEQYELD